MYNAKEQQEVKNRYLQTINEIKKKQTFERICRKAIVFEVALDKDLMDFDKQERLDFYKFLQITRHSTLHGINSIINGYVQWCYDNGYKTKANQEVYSYEELADCILPLSEIITLSELRKNITLLENPCDKVLLEAVFLGLKGEKYSEIMNLDINAIDKGKIKLCTGRYVKVTDQFIENCIASSKTYEYLIGNGTKQKLVGEPNRVIKTNAQSKASGLPTNYVGNRLHLLKKKPGIIETLGTSMLFDSGFVCQSKIAMIEHGFDDFEEFIKSKSSLEVVSQYGWKWEKAWYSVRRFQGYFE